MESFVSKSAWTFPFLLELLAIPKYSAIITIVSSIALYGCVSFKAVDSNETGSPNWKAATLFKERPNVAHNSDCVYKVKETQKVYTINNQQSCLPEIEVDVNSYKFTTVGIPILMGGMSEHFNYRAIASDVTGRRQPVDSKSDAQQEKGETKTLEVDGTSPVDLNDADEGILAAEY